MAGLKIAFMGTPDFAVPALDNLIASDHDVVCVYSQPPRPKGRGHKVIPSPVHALADDHGIDVRTPKRLKKNMEEIARFVALDIDVAVVAAYGLLLPKAVLDAPRFGCLNIHASLLPRWRGASPIQQAIWHGDTQTGVTIMQMEEGLDTGPMIEKRAVTIRPQSTAQAMHDQLSALCAAMIEDVLDQLGRGESLDHEVQDDELATYAPLLTRDNGKIDWLQTADQIDRQIRALNPWPGVWTTDRYQGQTNKHKILEAELVTMHVGQPPGTLVDKTGHVACGDDTALKLTRIHPSGASRPMDVLSAINGGYLRLNQSFDV